MKCTILTYLLTYLSREVLAVRWHRGVEQCHARQDITIISRRAFRHPGRTGGLAISSSDGDDAVSQRTLTDFFAERRATAIDNRSSSLRPCPRFDPCVSQLEMGKNSNPARTNRNRTHVLCQEPNPNPNPKGKKCARNTN